MRKRKRKSRSPLKGTRAKRKDLLDVVTIAENARADITVVIGLVARSADTVLIVRQTETLREGLVAGLQKERRDQGETEIEHLVDLARLGLVHIAVTVTGMTVADEKALPTNIYE